MGNKARTSVLKVIISTNFSCTYAIFSSYVKLFVKANYVYLCFNNGWRTGKQSSETWTSTFTIIKPGLVINFRLLSDIKY